MKFKRRSTFKKESYIEATQWFKNGDHPLDRNGNKEGKIVRYYNHPKIDWSVICNICNHVMKNHGWIDALESGHNVCPGDWIITIPIIGGVQEEYCPCKPDIFEEAYEPVKE